MPFLSPLYASPVEESSFHNQSLFPFQHPANHPLQNPTENSHMAMPLMPEPLHNGSDSKMAFMNNNDTRTVAAVAAAVVAGSQVDYSQSHVDDSRRSMLIQEPAQVQNFANGGRVRLASYNSSFMSFYTSQSASESFVNNPPPQQQQQQQQQPQQQQQQYLPTPTLPVATAAGPVHGAFEPAFQGMFAQSPNEFYQHQSQQQGSSVQNLNLNQNHLNQKPAFVEQRSLPISMLSHSPAHIQTSQPSLASNSMIQMSHGQKQQQLLQRRASLTFPINSISQQSSVFPPTITENRNNSDTNSFNFQHNQQQRHHQQHQQHQQHQHHQLPYRHQTPPAPPPTPIPFQLGGRNSTASLLQPSQKLPQPAGMDMNFVRPYNYFIIILLTRMLIKDPSHINSSTQQTSNTGQSGVNDSTLGGTGANIDLVEFCDRLAKEMLLIPGAATSMNARTEETVKSATSSPPSSKFANLESLNTIESGLQKDYSQQPTSQMVLDTCLDSVLSPEQLILHKNVSSIISTANSSPYLSPMTPHSASSLSLNLTPVSSPPHDQSVSPQAVPGNTDTSNFMPHRSNVANLFINTNFTNNPTMNAKCNSAHPSLITPLPATPTLPVSQPSPALTMAHASPCLSSVPVSSPVHSTQAPFPSTTATTMTMTMASTKPINKTKKPIKIEQGPLFCTTCLTSLNATLSIYAAEREYEASSTIIQISCCACNGVNGLSSAVGTDYMITSSESADLGNSGASVRALGAGGKPLRKRRVVKRGPSTPVHCESCLNLVGFGGVRLDKNSNGNPATNSVSAKNRFSPHQRVSEPSGNLKSSHDDDDWVPCPFPCEVLCSGCIKSSRKFKLIAFQIFANFLKF
jgi:hypothetical protein